MNDLRVLSGGALLSWLLLSVSCGGNQARNTAATGGTGAAAGTGATAGSSAAAGTGSAAGGTGSSNGGTAGEGGNDEPRDDRPERPPWKPPFPLGEPGWQGSTTPLCEPYRGFHAAFDVWAGADGVYALLSEGCNALAGQKCGAEALTLQHNDGTGWQRIYKSEPFSNLRLRGFPEGPAALVGGACGIAFIDREGASCSTSLSGLPPADVFLVGNDLGYAINDERVLEYRASSWKELAHLPTRGEAIWADGEHVVVAGFNQSIYVREKAGFVLLEDAPAGDYVSVWGFGPDDLWFGNRAGQLVHFDGTGWEVVPTGSENAIVGLWGSEGELFFRSSLEFGRWRNGKVEILLSGPGPDTDNPRIEVGGLWGRSPTEVFVSLVDAEFQQYRCGEHFVVWFDGNELHEF